MTIIEILHFINTLLSTVFIFYFIAATFRPKNPKKALVWLLILTFFSETAILISPSLHYLTYFLIIVFILFYFKERLLQKLSALLFLFSLIFCAQAVCTLGLYLPNLITGQEIYIHITEVQSDSFRYILFLCCNILFSCLSIYLAARLWNSIYFYLNLGIVCELFLYPHILCLEPVIYISESQFKWPILFIILPLCTIGNLSIFHGLYRMQNVLSEAEDDKYMKMLLQFQLKNYHQSEQQHLETRKWSHDMANHLQTLEYLLDNSEKKEAQDYLASLIENL